MLSYNGRIFKIGVFCDPLYLLNEVGDQNPISLFFPFFFLRGGGGGGGGEGSDIINSLSDHSISFKKICCVEEFRTNILKSLSSFSLQKLTDLIVELLDELKYEAEEILLENT